MSQNILVNWKVNTDEVAKSRDILTQANAAANKFQQTATQGAKSSKDAMAALVAEEKRLEAAIKGTQRTSFTSYAAFSKQLQGLSRQYSDVKVKIDQATKAIKDQEKAQQQLGKETKTVSQNYGNLANTIKAVFTVAVLKQSVDMTLQMAKLSGNVEGVRNAFFRAFPEGQLLLSELTRATHGAVSEFELMQRTLQATNLGVAAESLPVLFEFAAARAQQTGESVDYLVDSIVRGIGRKSILVLDNLGLSATRLREQFNGASLASQSVADVTRGVAEIARVELEKMGGFAETSATKVDQLAVSWSKLGKEISELATQDGGLIDFFKSYTDSFALLVEAQNKGISVSELSAQKQREHNAEVLAGIFFNTALTDSKEENIKTLDTEIARLTRSIGAWASLRDQMEKNNAEDRERIELLNKSAVANFQEIVDLEKEIAFRKRIIDAKREETLEDQEFLKLLLLRLATLKEIKGVTEQLGLIAAKQAEIESTSDDIQAAKSTDEIHRLNIELERLNGELADLKAFGTTKRQLIVNGQLKLVPVVAPKNQAETLAPDSRDFTDQLDDFIKNSLIGLGPYNLKLNLDYNRSAPSKTPGAIQNIGPMAKPQEIVPMDEWEKIGQEFADNWQSILGQGLGDTTSFFDSVLQAEADNYDARINQSRQYYDRLMILAGDNEKAKDRLRLKEQKEENKLRREAFEADKRAKRASAVINGAAGVINAFATLPYPAAIVAAALIAAETAAQIAVINRQQPRFAKGVIDLKGPGTKTSDSIPAKLSKGESVMTADETSSAGGILRDIRAGKLNDRKLAKQLDAAVLRDLKLTKDGVKMVGMDDSRIVKEIQDLKNSQPDIKKMNGLLMEARVKREKYIQWVRAKIM